MSKSPTISLLSKDVASPDFAHHCVGELLRYGRWHAETNVGARWSLCDSGMGAADWAALREWASHCGPEACIEANGLAAGAMMVAVAAAIGRTLSDEGLWRSMAEACSPHLRRLWFSRTDYLRQECLPAFEDACRDLHLRQELDLREKHYYWRTVKLQFGFSAKSAARQLPLWLHGWNMPETVNTLLEDGENSSPRFQALWKLLKHWKDNPSDQSIVKQLKSNVWYPGEDHALLEQAMLRESASSPSVAAKRLEDEQADPTLFATPCFQGGAFRLQLSRQLPAQLACVRRTISMSMGPMGVHRLIPDEEQGFQLEDSPLVLPIDEVLAGPSIEVKLRLPGGSGYQERFSFWNEEDDIVFFSGMGGRRRSTAPIAGESGACVMIVRENLAVSVASDLCMPDHASPLWALYLFPSGLPSALSVHAGEDIVWSGGTFLLERDPEALRGRLEIREHSQTCVQLRVRPPRDWECVRFRFAGKAFSGAVGSTEIDPSALDRRVKAVAKLRRGNDTADALLDTLVIPPRAAGIAFQDETGAWQPIGHAAQGIDWTGSSGGVCLPIDASVLEGRPLAPRWDQDGSEGWLMLGNQAISPERGRLRRQSIPTMGEGFQLRTGLMNEAGPRVEMPPMYSSGLLARTEADQQIIRLCLREQMEAAENYRVSVWERGRPVPRTLDRAETEVHGGGIEILSLSVHEPMGWAISLENEWRGARFAVEPGQPGWRELEAGWCATIESAPDWQSTAQALCAWRFPVLMEPFAAVVRTRATAALAQCLIGWTEKAELDGCALQAEPSLYTAPLRELLWGSAIDRSVVEACWMRFLPQFCPANSSMQLSPPAEVLLRANPVLLAKILGDRLRADHEQGKQRLPRIQKTIFQKVHEPGAAEHHRAEFDRQARLILLSLKGAFGVYNTGAPHELAELEQGALMGLRSWSDHAPMDEHFFRCRIRDTAEKLYQGCSVDSKQLQLAVARSPVCCAYLAAYLFCKHVYLPLRKDEL